MINLDLGLKPYGVYVYADIDGKTVVTRVGMAATLADAKALIKSERKSMRELAPLIGPMTDGVERVYVIHKLTYERAAVIKY